MMDPIRAGLWGSRINTTIACLFVGSYVLGLSLILWHAATGENPIANAMVKQLQAASSSSN